MKNFMFLILFVGFSNSYLFSETWEQHWINAINHCEKNEFLEAEKEFTFSIKVLETANDKKHPTVYVDRARIYLLLDEYSKALADVTKALDSGLVGKDLSRALLTRINASVNLGLDDQIINDHEALKNCGVLPKVEFTEDYVIIRDIPDCECSREFITKFLVKSGICERESDINMTNSGFCIAKRKKIDCGCNKKEELQPKTIEGCKAWCDRTAIAGYTWCGHTFKRYAC